MRENKIEINPFKLLDIISFKGVQRINDHGYITFSGHIEPAEEEACLSAAMQDNPIVQVFVSNETDRKTFFAGVLTEVEIEVKNQLKILIATVNTGSYLMDLTPHIRSFQSADTSYSDILNVLGKNYKNASFHLNAVNGKRIEGLILQYQETDWEFAKRLASRLGTVLIPNGQYGYPAYDFGLLQNEKCAEIESKTYSITKDLGRFLHNSGNGVREQSETDMICYIYKSREIYDLGERVIFNHQPFYICSIETGMEGGELYHTYYLAMEAGLRVPQKFNLEMIGLSLAARVTGVQKDSVQVAIEKDENQSASGKRWFPYSTVYSSPDGTGWYCMPEIGDAVRLYIPCEHEEQACAASSVHLPVTAGSSRSNPNHKSIMNKQGKEVLFTPDSLLITNNAGMSLELSDREGIKIISDKAIQIKSDEAIDIVSAASTVQMTAPQELVFNQGGTEMKLKDQLFLKGAQVRLD